MSPPFKKCDVCGGKVPVQDPHSSCLLCLGRNHDAKACPLCKSMSSQARKNRESRLTSAIAQGKIRERDPSPASAPSAPTAAPPTSAHASPASAPPDLASVAHDLGQTVPVPAVGYGSSKPSAASKPAHKPKKSADVGIPFAREEATTSKRAATGHKSREASILSDSTKKLKGSEKPPKEGKAARDHATISKADGFGSSSSKAATDGKGGSDLKITEMPIPFFLPDIPRDSASSKKRALSTAGSTVGSTPEVPTSKRAKTKDHTKVRSGAGTGKDDSRGRRCSRSRSPLPRGHQPVSPDRRQASKRHLSQEEPKQEDLAAPVGATARVGQPSATEPSASTAVSYVDLEEDEARPHRRRSPVPSQTRVRSPTPSPVQEPDVEDFFYDSESDRFYMAVPRDVAMLKFPPGHDWYRDDATSRGADRSCSLTRRGAVQPRTKTVVETILSDSEPDPPAESDAPSDDEDRADDLSLGLHQPEPASPTDDVRSFAEHVIKMSRALDIELPYPEEAAKDPIERRVQGWMQTPPSIPFLPSLKSLVKRSWDAPASLLGPPRKIESLYRVSSPNAPWLASHPRQNSAIVEGAQHTSTQRQSSFPLDKEAKKIDALSRKAYTASALAVKAINYVACMGAYVQTLMEGISPIIPDVPDDAQRTLAEIRDETHSIGSWLITASRNVAECTGRAMAASIALRRHAWLRGSDLNQGVRTTIEEMPIDDSGLFHADTDDKLNRKFRMKAATRKHGMSAPGTSQFRK
ncbi:E3 ubiquitin-protein ligase MARCHF3 isoform X1 [Sceloporus undulatus]|uniref:E3 ubiquitin-protein ligase MARCHF3 isoform X1 n=1 Tax=Sceloporus undulatus TaxID=8520 RepID=UPI001C4D3C88|nr:E3 ubiquitin-protein ligase MARCHF3 isoform X1 [Sceloporus undulatus]XP_042311870.1 E3 ubiquitin-protein ligase MARCHF3 isoform X1 [Sceloporus undulatus]XP_042311871.1 E3 ubiquitin-protein ligase MARCHF3 isoform X1 [Sceloporus undulatus]